MKRSSSSPFSQLSSFLCGALVVSSFTLTPAAAIDPVCIVGAGPTGLTIAHELESKNYTTVIFEKQSVVGGKCQAYYDGPNGTTYHPLGALLFTNETYHNTLPIVLDSGEPLTPGIAPPDWHRYVYGPGAEASHVVPQPTPNNTETAAIAAEIQKYTIYWTTEFAPKYSAMRYVNGIPDAYSDPIATFLQREGYVYLPSIMQMGMVPYGYGDVTETPTIYMLQYFTPEVLGVFVAATKSYIVDFHRVFMHYAGTLKASAIQLNTTITSIDRTNASAPVITYTASDSSSEQTQICSHIVLAFPPLLHALQALNMPLTDDETSLFSKLSSTPYWSSAVSVNTAYHNSYLQSPFAPLDEPVAFLRLFNESDVATAWQWGNISSTDQAKILLASTLTKVQTGAGVNPSTVTADDVRDIRTWDYFAHFTGEDLTAGNAYESFNKLQGVDGTYYASGLNGFETVEFAVRAGKDIVNSFF